MTMQPLLEVDAVTKRFGRVVVADGLSFGVHQSETLGIVGPNGAGKTSLFGMIAGDLRVDSGDVRLSGTSLTSLSTARRVRRGVVRTHQVPRPFTGMTVFENVLVAAQQGGGQRGQSAVDRAIGVIEETGLGDHANVVSGRLGLLSRKRLEVARALACDPRLLLLDEVAGGLTDPEVDELVSIVRGVNARGVTVLWIEHVVRALVSTVDRLVCLALGSLLADGRPSEVLARPEVKRIFLGTDPAVDEAPGDTP